MESKDELKEIDIKMLIFLRYNERYSYFFW